MKKLILSFVVMMLVCIMANCGSEGEVLIQDTSPPSKPTGVSGAATSSTSIDLNWAVSTDNVGVTGYRVYRSNMQISDNVSTSLTDTGLESSQTYFYVVEAYDAANNVSEQSSMVPVKTLTLTFDDPEDTPDVNVNNNLTVVDLRHNLVGGANDVKFIWDGTLKTSVATSGQSYNATISSDCTFYGSTWWAHDVAIYGPGTYTIYTGCPARSPGCGESVSCSGAGCIGKTELKELFAAWNGDSYSLGSKNGCPASLTSCTPDLQAGSFVSDYQIDPIDGGAWSMSYTQVVSSGPFENVTISILLRGTVNSVGQPDLPLAGTVLGLEPGAGSGSAPCATGSCFGMEVAPSTWTWTDFGPGTDGGFVVGKAQKSGGQELATSVTNTTPGELTNAWWFFANYGTFFTSPGGETNLFMGTPITFTVGADEIGVHMLLDFDDETDVDVVNVWKANDVFTPSPLYPGGCGSNSEATNWGWMSKDVNGDGVNGYPMVDGPYAGYNFNFNLK